MSKRTDAAERRWRPSSIAFAKKNRSRWQPMSSVNPPRPAPRDNVPVGNVERRGPYKKPLARSIAPAPKRVDPVARHHATARAPSIAPNRKSLKRNRRPASVEQHRAAEQIPGDQRQGIKSVSSPAGNVEANGRRSPDRGSAKLPPRSLD